MDQKIDCPYCHGEGSIFTRDSHARDKLYRCGKCAAGAKFAGPIYFPSDKDKKYPYFLPAWPREITPAPIQPLSKQQFDPRAAACGEGKDE